MKHIKRTILFIGLVLLVQTLTHAQQSDPAQVLELFFTSLGKQDVPTARNYATADSKPMLDMIEMGINMMKAKAKEKGKTLPAFNMKRLEMGKPFIRGDYATVNTTEKESKETVTFSLHKEQGEWKVVFNQATLTKMAADKGIDVNKTPMPKPKQ